MGAWGTSLYANDAASDIRGDYLDGLRRGKSNEELTRELAAQYSDPRDPEEDALFWFALADTQWNYGRLLPEVLERALHYLPLESSRERWAEEGEKKLAAWEITLEKLEKKLATPQPPEKRVSAYKFYHCEWNLGDVFAYQLLGEESREHGLHGKFIAFRKVSGTLEWPGNTIPVVKVYDWVGDDVPNLAFLMTQRYLPMAFAPVAHAYRPRLAVDFRISLSISSRRMIPKEGFVYVGNLPGSDLTEWTEPSCIRDGAFLKRKGPNQLEDRFLNQYLEWNAPDVPAVAVKRRLEAEERYSS